ncbi:hypothetical protein ES703_57415 [subsurface metagenome]
MGKKTVNNNKTSIGNLPNDLYAFPAFAGTSSPV